MIIFAAFALCWVLGVVCGLALFPRLIRAWVDAAMREVVGKSESKNARFGMFQVTVKGRSGSREVDLTYAPTE